MIDNNDKINYIPHHIKMTADYNTNLTINSSFKQLLYKPDFFCDDSVRFIINSNGFLDPYSLNFMFTVKIDDNDVAFDWLQLDGSAHSLINKIVISSCGVELERIDNYEYLNSILFDINLNNDIRKNLEHHGFGYEYKNELAYGTGEDCFPSTYHDEEFKQILKNSRSNNIISVNHGIPDSCNFNIRNNTRSKTYIIPLLSFIFGMNVSEYKYIPLHLFPYLQIEIFFNKYGIFKQVKNNIKINNAELSNYNEKKYEFYNIQYQNVVNNLITKIININPTYKNSDSMNRFKYMLHTFIEIDMTLNNEFILNILSDLFSGNNNEDNNARVFIAGIAGQNKEYWGGLMIAILFNYVTYNMNGFDMSLYDLNNEYKIIRQFYDKREKYRKLNGTYFGGRRNLSNNRSFKILDKCYINTEQLFFEVSDHYKMINSINSFSISTLGYDSQKIAFNEFNKPNECVNVNFPRSSIRKFFSTFYSYNYLNDSTKRQLARYSCNVSNYSVRINTNNYPQNMLVGDTSSSNNELLNNTTFLDELYKAFDQIEYNNTITRGIINSKNYAINFQTQDQIIDLHEYCIPHKLYKIKHDVVGKCVICVRTSKLNKMNGLFNGENNSMGSDIVRCIKTYDNPIKFLKQSFFELIMIEYDLLLIINGVGNIKIIK